MRIVVPMWAKIAVLALLGVSTGLAVRANRAEACDCIGGAWSLELQSVTSSDPAVSHRPYWPESGSLSVIGGRTGLTLYRREARRQGEVTSVDVR